RHLAQLPLGRTKVTDLGVVDLDPPDVGGEASQLAQLLGRELLHVRRDVAVLAAHDDVHPHLRTPTWARLPRTQVAGATAATASGSTPGVYGAHRSRSAGGSCGVGVAVEVRPVDDEERRHPFDDLVERRPVGARVDLLPQVSDQLRAQHGVMLVGLAWRHQIRRGPYRPGGTTPRVVARRSGPVARGTAHSLAPD